MFCGKCGSQLEEGAKFCPKCGSQVDESPKETGQKTQAGPENHRSGNRGTGKISPKGKGPGKLVVLAAVALIVFLVGGGTVYATAGLTMQKNNLVSEIEDAGFQEYEEEVQNAVSRWDRLGLTDVGKKRTVIKNLKSMTKEIDEFYEDVEELDAMEGEKEQYELETSSYGTYTAALEECRQAVKDKQVKETLARFDEAEAALQDLLDANEAYIDSQVSVYEGIDMSEAEDSEVSDYEKAMKQITKLAESDEKDYPAIREAFEEMDEIVYLYVEPEKELDIEVQQVDASEFPKVRLYLNLEDPSTGEVPEDLKGPMFYIQKKDANAEYVKQKVTEVNQLNELEALTIDMVADVSGSMEGGPLDEAKTIMNNFISSVQFDAGDLVELTSFATGVRLEQEFCDDADLLSQKVNALYTGDMTSLYDALYTAVERVAAQTGARCVIAFTDGNDNYSNCTRDDVIAVANRYHIPVFIIGIGAIDSSEISYIASQTGGAYYSVNDVYSMDSIYQQIYEMEKELYLLEFEDSTGATVDDQADIQVGYHSTEYGGECAYTYKPNVLLSAKSSSIYTDGPEAVVEQYLKNFPAAVTNGDFSLIEDCLKAGSDIYNEQKKYVQRDITEQLDTYELTDVSYSGDSSCVVSTRETYNVQVQGKALQLMTQECKYRLEKSGDKWEMTAFEDLKVVSRIKQ